MLHGLVGAHPDQRVGCPRLGRLAEPALTDGPEVQVLSARVPEQAEVPDVLAERALVDGVGEMDPVDAVAGKADVVLVAVDIEVAEVEVEHRRNPGSSQVVEVGVDVRRGADLVTDPTADRIEHLQAHQLGQSAQAQHPSVGRLADPGGPRQEGLGAGAALGAPHPVMRLAQLGLVTVGLEVARGRDTRPVAGKRASSSKELDEARPCGSSSTPGGVVGAAEILGADGHSLAALISGVNDASLLGEPPALLAAWPAAFQPGLEVDVACGRELVAVEAAQRARPVAKMRAARHLACLHPSKRTARMRDDEQSLGIEVVCQQLVVDERGHLGHAPVAARQPVRRVRPQCRCRPHPPALLARASTAAHMSSHRACK